MTTDITGADWEHLLEEGWSTPLEAGVRGTIRGFIEALPGEELEAAVRRGRYAPLRTAAGAGPAGSAASAGGCGRRSGRGRSAVGATLGSGPRRRSLRRRRPGSAMGR